MDMSKGLGWLQAADKQVGLGWVMRVGEGEERGGDGGDQVGGAARRKEILDHFLVQNCRPSFPTVPFL